SIMITMFPVADETFIDEAVEQEIALLRDAIGAVRNLRAEYNVPPSLPLAVTVIAADEAARASLERNWPLGRGLGKVSSFQLVADGEAPAGSVAAVVGGLQVCLSLAGAIDVQAEAARISKDREKTERERAQIAGRLGNEAFVARAPGPVVEKE